MPHRLETHARVDQKEDMRIIESTAGLMLVVPPAKYSPIECKGPPHPTPIINGCSEPGLNSPGLSS